MRHRAWAIAERMSLPVVYAELKARATGHPAGIIEERIESGPDSAQHVLLVTPETRRPGDPLVFFIHGGSWRYGSPSLFRAVGRFFAAHGYTAALGGYRLVPGAHFPAQLHDSIDGLRAALAWRASAGHADGPVVIAGQSAGGHLAALTAFDERSRAARGLGDLNVSGLLAVSGVLDLDVLCPDRKMCPIVAALMDGYDGWEKADPSRLVHGAPDIPILCLHGSRDPLVPVEVAASFVLRANGTDGDHATFLADPDAHHADMTRLFFGASPLTRGLLEWLDDVSSVTR
ncbi:MAG: alpha/beta hydrolase [Coriobacteriia bacterium]|nr:alpha/beta hydrolase [Coriobacteriia bacterium]